MTKNRLILAATAIVLAAACDTPKAQRAPGDTARADGPPPTHLTQKVVMRKLPPDTLMAEDGTKCVVSTPHYAITDSGATFNCVEWVR